VFSGFPYGGFGAGFDSNAVITLDREAYNSKFTDVSISKEFISGQEYSYTLEVNIIGDNSIGRAVVPIRQTVTYEVIKRQFYHAVTVLGNSFVEWEIIPVEQDPYTEVVNDYTSIEKVSNTYLYRGIGFPFIENKKVQEKTDAELIGDSIKQIVMTQKGERVFRPDFGTNIKVLLFENETEFLYNDIVNEIIVACNEYEPRAKVVDVVVNNSNDIIYADVFYEFNGEVNNVNIKLS